MRYIMSILLIINTSIIVGQNCDSTNANNLVGQKLNELKAELVKKGIDTILVYSNWAISENNTYFGDGLLSWETSGKYFTQTVKYDKIAKKIIVGCESVSDGMPIRFFFSKNLKEVKENPKDSGPTPDHSKDIEVSLNYNNSCYCFTIEEYKLYQSPKDKRVKWILMMEKELEKH